MISPLKRYLSTSRHAVYWEARLLQGQQGFQRVLRGLQHEDIEFRLVSAQEKTVVGSASDQDRVLRFADVFPTGRADPVPDPAAEDAASTLSRTHA